MIDVFSQHVWLRHLGREMSSHINAHLAEILSSLDAHEYVHALSIQKVLEGESICQLRSRPYHHQSKESGAYERKNAIEQNWI